MLNGWLSQLPSTGVALNSNDPIFNANKLFNIPIPTGTPLAGQIIKFNGSVWTFAPDVSGEAGPDTFAALIDTAFTGLASGDLASFNGGTWLNKSLFDLNIAASSDLSTHVADTGNPHSTSFLNLIDTIFTGLASGNIVEYNGNDWENKSFTDKSVIFVGPNGELTEDNARFRYLSASRRLELLDNNTGNAPRVVLINSNSGGLAQSSFQANNGAQTTQMGMESSTNDRGFLKTGATQLLIDASPVGGFIKFTAGGAGSEPEIMRITSDKRVGVVNPAPTRTLDVKGVADVAISGIVTVNDGSTAVAGSGTTFLSDYGSGCAITLAVVGNPAREVVQVTDDENLIVATVWSSAESGVVALKDHAIFAVQNSLGNTIFEVQDCKIDILSSNPEAIITIGGQVDFTSTIGVPLASGSIVFIDGQQNLSQDNSNFFWDDINNRLGIGTNNPNDVIDVRTNTNAPDHILINNSGSGVSTQAQFRAESDVSNITTFATASTHNSPDFDILSVNGLTAGNCGLFGSGNALSVVNAQSSGIINFGVGGTKLANEVMRISESGNVGIGIRFPANPLHVSGDAQFDNNFTDGTNKVNIAEIRAHLDASENAVTVLASVTGIDGTSTGTTNIYTVPTGKETIVQALSIRLTAISGAGSVVKLGLGIASGEDDIFADVDLTGLDATNKLYKFNSGGTQRKGEAAEIIKIGIDTAATFPTYTFSADLIGYEV